jgi:phospholipid/cholesterol/gamma-HCH transport system substrate-binding protein
MPSPQRVSWAKFRVSVVSSVAFLILLTLFYLLTGGTLLSQKETIYLYLPDGSGLEAEAPVRVDGIDVGKVKSVRLSGAGDPQREVVVTMEVERARLSSIPTNSEAELSSDSLIGDRFVDITSHPATTSLPPGGEIRLKPSTDLMKTIDIRDLEKQVVQVDAMLRDLEQGRGPVGEFVKGRQMYDSTVKRFTEIDDVLTAAVSVTTTMGNLLYKDEVYRKFFDAVVRIDDALARLQSGQGSAGHFLRDTTQYDEWQKAIIGIRKTVADLRATPWIQSDEQYVAWNRSLAALIAQVDEFNSNPAFITSEAYDRINGMARELAKSLRDFRAHPERFLRMKMF